MGSPAGTQRQRIVGAEGIVCRQHPQQQLDLFSQIGFEQCGSEGAFGFLKRTKNSDGRIKPFVSEQTSRKMFKKVEKWGASAAKQRHNAGTQVELFHLGKPYVLFFVFFSSCNLCWLNVSVCAAQRSKFKMNLDVDPK